MSTICILGRQPELGLVELESLFGSGQVKHLGDAAALVEHEGDFPFDRLGGTVKAAKLLTRLDTTDWLKLESHIIEQLPSHLQHVPEGKLKIGLSLYGIPISVGKLNASGLNIKKAIKTLGRSVRIVPNKQPELNTAQVLHNQLTGPNGWELLFIREGNSTVIAQTIRVQDIEAYAARDQVRPKRDSRVGMLPPKLAQIIINLATGQIVNDEWRMVNNDKTNKPSFTIHSSPFTILDPFCGTGVVLQEALLIGYNVYGTDLEPRMVEYTRANLDWLNITSLQRRTEQGDATTHQWEQPFSVVAAETYLGRPFSAEPKPEVLREVMQDVDTIHRKFLKNVARQTSAGFRMCIAVPAWKSRNGFQHLKMLDSIKELGYNRLSFVHAGGKELIYHREGQFVGRELVVLERI
jgi:SAM-dependent methyltransferase